MRPALFAHWGLGLLLVISAATSACKRSSAAQPSYNKPPDGPSPDLPIPPEPAFTKSDIRIRDILLGILTSKKINGQLLSHDSLIQQQEAKTSFAHTFTRGSWLPNDLRDKIQVGETTCGLNGCSVDVTYPDWATFVALDNAVLDHQPASPFMSFPGARYRTPRVKQADHKVVASWILAFRLRPPVEYQDKNQKEVP
jgi:hypothetical protein